MKLKPGDIFWDSTSICLVYKDAGILRNLRLGSMWPGALTGEALENYFEDPSIGRKKYLGNINNINQELINIFKEQGVL